MQCAPNRDIFTRSVHTRAGDCFVVHVSSWNRAGDDFSNILKSGFETRFLLGSTNKVLVHTVAGAFKTGVSKKGKKIATQHCFRNNVCPYKHTWRHVLHDRSRTLGMHISMLTESELYTLLQKILRVNFLLLSCYFYLILQFENDWMISQDPRYFRININNRMFFFIKSLSQMFSICFPSLCPQRLLVSNCTLVRHHYKL